MYLNPPRSEGLDIAVARPICQISKTLVTVTESYVEFKTNQVFLNDNDHPLEGIFIFPLPNEKSIRIKEVWIEGKGQAFDIIKANELFSLVKKITIETEDPSLMAIVNSPAIVLSSVRLNIRESKSFRISYRIPLKITDNVLDIDLNMEGERYALAPIGEFEIQVRFKLSRSLRTSISPSHRIDIVNESDERRLVSVKETEIRRPSDFRLLTSVGGSGLSVKLLFYPSTTKAGHFLAMVEPPLSRFDKRSPPLDLAILLDCSGSMGPKHLMLGRKAVSLFLEKLRPTDRFDIIKITSRQKRLFGRLVEATPKRVSDGLGFLVEPDDGDGTDLFNGVLCGLETLSSKKRPGFMILISDGKSTIGKTGGEALVEMIRRYNKNRTRIFVLALGDAPDLTILDQIAKTSGGSVFHANESNNLEGGIHRWLSSVISPRVVDLVLNLKDLDPELVVPEPIPEIMGQESVIVTGLYRKAPNGGASVSVKGKIDGNTVVGVSKPEVSTQARPHHFIAHLWAMRRMANLIDLDRTKGKNQSLVGKIGEINQSFGFETRDDDLAGERDFYKLLWKYKTSFIPEEVTAKECRRIGNRIFKTIDGCLTQTDLESSSPEQDIMFLSKEYFDLIKLNSELAPIVALGPEVKFYDRDQTVRITRSKTQKSLMNQQYIGHD
ncbi:MAG: VWA domain-containing protein [Pseudomonadota bacterium]